MEMLELSDSTNDVKSGTEIKIDYFSGTFEFRNYLDDQELQDVEDTVHAMANLLNVPKEEILEADYGKGNYRYLFHLGDGIDLKICGPINKIGNRTCSLQMKGSGCRYFERNNPDKDWEELLLSFHTYFDMKATRIDIAIDDFDGDVIPFNWLWQKIEKRSYTSTFNSPPTFIKNERDGSSITFGSRKSTQMLVIYEKDKEQSAKGYEHNQSYWTRIEMRFQHEKADLVFTDIIYAFMGKIRYPEEKIIPEGEEGFKIFSKSTLYNMLDIKEDNEYDDRNKSKVPTDTNWLRFLGNVEKAKFSPLTKAEPKWLRHEMYIKENIPTYLLVRYLAANKNPQQFGKDMLKLLYYSLEDFIDKKNKLKKTNTFLKECGIDLLDDDAIYEIETELKKYLLDEELPF